MCVECVNGLIHYGCCPALLIKFLPTCLYKNYRDLNIHILFKWMNFIDRKGFLVRTKHPMFFIHFCYSFLIYMFLSIGIAIIPF